MTLTYAQVADKAKNIPKPTVIQNRGIYKKTNKKKINKQYNQQYDIRCHKCDFSSNINDLEKHANEEHLKDGYTKIIVCKKCCKKCCFYLYIRNGETDENVIADHNNKIHFLKKFKTYEKYPKDQTIEYATKKFLEETKYLLKIVNI